MESTDNGGKTIMKTTYGCKHRPERLYASVVPKVHNAPWLGKLLVVTCCDCGEVWERDAKGKAA